MSHCLARTSSQRRRGGGDGGGGGGGGGGATENPKQSTSHNQWMRSINQSHDVPSTGLGSCHTCTHTSSNRTYQNYHIVVGSGEGRQTYRVWLVMVKVVQYAQQHQAFTHQPMPTNHQGSRPTIHANQPGIEEPIKPYTSRKQATNQTDKQQESTHQQHTHRGDGGGGGRDGG